MPWVEDGLSEVERDAIDELLYIAVADTQSLAATLGLPWVRDAISEVERDALDQLSGIGYYDSQSLAATLGLPWVRDAISEVERDALDQLSGIGYYDSQSLAATLGLPWVRDAISEVERDAIDELLYIAVADTQSLAATLGLPWVRDAISEVERDALDQLSGIGYYDSQSLAATLSLPWVQDAISEVEYDAVYWIRAISYYDGKVAAAIIPMPFLRVPDVTDVLALRSIHALASRGVLAPLLEHPTFLDGIAEGETTLVTAVGTLYSDIEEISRMLDPGYASIESVAIETDLTPHLPINIIRAGSEPTRWAADAMAGAVGFTEGAMLVSLPIDHLILVLSDKAVTKNYAGTNYGFAFSFLPEYEQKQNTFEGQAFLRGIVHEVGHYYWGGSNEGWINEGLANTIEHMYGIANGLSPGQLKTLRGDCEAHDLEMLSEWAPPTSSVAEYYCNYYLGELLFLELRESLGDAGFSEKMRELYQLTLTQQEAGQTPGIAAVRQVFTDQASIVEKHWSGKLNAPENRPFDEGIGRTSHDLIQWDQHPTYDGHDVTFRGTLLNDAGLSRETISQAREGGYTNFVLRPADDRGYAGSILPPFNDGLRWTLEDPGDTVATVYLLEDRTFTVTFTFPQALGSPSDYAVTVSGFRDASRTPSIGENIDILGYARIRIANAENPEAEG